LLARKGCRKKITGEEIKGECSKALKTKGYGGEAAMEGRTVDPDFYSQKKKKGKQFWPESNRRVCVIGREGMTDLKREAVAARGYEKKKKARWVLT